MTMATVDYKDNHHQEWDNKDNDRKTRRCQDQGMTGMRTMTLRRTSTRAMGTARTTRMTTAEMTGMMGAKTSQE